jgi:hypothetical protein
MEWLKNNYEKASLNVAGVALLISCAWIITRALSFSQQLTGRDSSKPPDNAIKALPADALATASKMLKSPQNWIGHEGSLLVSRPYVLVDGALIDPLESVRNLHEPIKNSWLVKYDLPWWESDVANQDPDGDGFSNLEEYLADTHPGDKNSHPPYYTKLRLLRFIAKPFRLIFTGTPDDGQTFSINTKERGGRTRFVERGQMIAGTPYKVLSYEKKTETKNEIEIDVSTLTIENTQTGHQILLIANKEADDPTSFGEFLYTWHPPNQEASRFTVKKDDEFALPPETQRKYKLIEISEKEAVIRDQTTGEQHRIPPAQ